MQPSGPAGPGSTSPAEPGPSVGPPYPYMAYPPPSPPPRQDKTVMIIVIVIAVALVGTMVVAAVLYVLVSGLIGGPQTDRPFVALSASPQGDGNESIAVVGASRQESTANYRVSLWVGTNMGTAVSIPPSGEFGLLRVGSTTFRMYWTDGDGDFALSTGDSFRVTGDGTPLPLGTTFSFWLLWLDGGPIATADFESR